MNPKIRLLLFATLIVTALLGGFVAWRTSVVVDLRKRIDVAKVAAEKHEAKDREIRKVVDALSEIELPDGEPSSKGESAEITSELLRAKTMSTETRGRARRIRAWIGQAEAWAAGVGWLFTTDPPPTQPSLF